MMIFKPDGILRYTTYNEAMMQATLESENGSDLHLAKSHSEHKHWRVVNQRTGKAIPFNHRDLMRSFPEGEIGEDNDGQLVIYTGLESK